MGIWFMIEDFLMKPIKATDFNLKNSGKIIKKFINHAVRNTKNVSTNYY
jgi:hypothetical protein